MDRLRDVAFDLRAFLADVLLRADLELRVALVLLLAIADLRFKPKPLDLVTL